MDRLELEFVQHLSSSFPLILCPRLAALRRQALDDFGRRTQANSLLYRFRTAERTVVDAPKWPKADWLSDPTLTCIGNEIIQRILLQRTSFYPFPSSPATSPSTPRVLPSAVWILAWRRQPALRKVHENYRLLHFSINHEISATRHYEFPRPFDVLYGQSLERCARTTGTFTTFGQLFSGCTAVTMSMNAMVRSAG